MLVISDGLGTGDDLFVIKNHGRNRIDAALLIKPFEFAHCLAELSGGQKLLRTLAIESDCACQCH
ncbi:hypothetical protein D3C78_1876030 [compost metagenome]